MDGMDADARYDATFLSAFIPFIPSIGGSWLFGLAHSSRSTTGKCSL